MLAAEAAEDTNEQTDINSGEEGASEWCRAGGLDRRGWWLGMPLGKRHMEAEGHLGIKARAFPSKKKLKERQEGQVYLYLGQGKQAESPPNPQPRLAKVTLDQG